MLNMNTNLEITKISCKCADMLAFVIGWSVEVGTLVCRALVVGFTMYQVNTCWPPTDNYIFTSEKQAPDSALGLF